RKSSGEKYGLAEEERPVFHVQLVPLWPNYSDGDDPGPITVTHFPFVVGRNPDADHRINDPMISRRHCACSVRDGRGHVADLGSRNGTRRSGDPLTEARPLGDGDRLDLFYLPFQVRLLGAAAVAPEAAGPDRAPAVGSRQVLVVEDDDTAAVALAGLLQSWGCSVRVARDGAEAIRAAREEPPDTVFLDIRLPGISRVGVARP